MRTSRVLALALASFTMLPQGAVAQEPVPERLTLARAVEIAERNNPAYLQTLNDRDLAQWDIRQAYGQLYLPAANASTSFGWQGTGDQQFGSITLGDLGFGEQPSTYSSSFSLGLSYNLSLSQLKAPEQAKVEAGVTDARIRLAGFDLATRVTNAYLEVLRQQEAVRLAEQQLENSSFNLRLARGRLEVGAVTPIDVGQAEVLVGRSEVGVLQARNALATARMRLLQQMGLPVDQEPTLVTEFRLTEPTWDMAGLYAEAIASNPSLQASRLSYESADIGVTRAKSAYFPSMSISTGLSGFTREASSTDFEIAQAQSQVAGQVQQCAFQNELYSRLADPLPLQDCTRFQFTDADRLAILDNNDQFPFGFSRSPPSVSLSLSVPIFQGFSRQRNLEAARLQRSDLAHQLRERELALRADLSVVMADIETAYQSALLEGRNRDLAEQQLRLARERYQLGAITFVELMDAQTVLAQAERDRLNAVFLYHDAVTALEALVGTSLRT